MGASPFPPLYYYNTMNNEKYAAIAMALYEAEGYTMHDAESGKMTIKPKDSEWSSKVQKMTQMP